MAGEDVGSVVATRAASRCIPFGPTPLDISTTVSNGESRTMGSWRSVLQRGRYASLLVLLGGKNVNVWPCTCTYIPSHITMSCNLSK